MSIHPANGFIVTPTSLINSSLIFAAKAFFPKCSTYLIPWYPSVGSVNAGNLPEAAQSKRPESTTTPAITLP